MVEIKIQNKEIEFISWSHKSITTGEQPQELNSFEIKQTGKLRKYYINGERVKNTDQLQTICTKCNTNLYNMQLSYVIGLIDGKRESIPTFICRSCSCKENAKKVDIDKRNKIRKENWDKKTPEELEIIRQNLSDAKIGHVTEDMIKEAIRVYVEEEKPLREVIKVLQIENLTTAKKILEKHGVKTRTYSEAKSLAMSKNNIMDKPGVRKKHKKNVKKGMSKLTKKDKQRMMIKQFETKRKNGTFNCTGIEDKYAAILDAQGIEYIREYIIPEGTKRYRYDFYIPSKHLLVEINGTGTHADPEKYLAEDVLNLGIAGWEKKTAQEIWDYDEKKRVYAVKKGYGIKTVWEREL